MCKKILILCGNLKVPCIKVCSVFDTWILTLLLFKQVWFKNRRAKHRRERKHSEKMLLASQRNYCSLPQSFSNFGKSWPASDVDSLFPSVKYPNDSPQPYMFPVLVPSAINQHDQIWCAPCTSCIQQELPQASRRVNYEDEYCLSFS